MNEYINIVKVKKTEIEGSFDAFLKMLNKVENNPEIIFTEFFEQLENPNFLIAEWTPDAFKTYFIPCIKKIPVFNMFNIKSSDYGKSIGIYFKDIAIMHISPENKFFELLISDKKPTSVVDLYIKDITNPFPAVSLSEKVYKYGVSYKKYLNEAEKKLDKWWIFFRKKKFKDKSLKYKEKIEYIINDTDAHKSNFYNLSMSVYNSCRYEIENLIHFFENLGYVDKTSKSL